MSQVPEKCQECASLEECRKSGFFELLRGSRAREESREGLLAEAHEIDELSEALSRIQGVSALTDELGAEYEVAAETGDIYKEDIEPLGEAGKSLIDFLRVFGLGERRVPDMITAMLCIAYKLGYVRCVKNLKEGQDAEA